MSALSDFDAKAPGQSEAPSDYDHLFESFFFNFLPHVSEAHARLIINKIQELDLGIAFKDGADYGADYDLTAEVGSLIRAVRAMQDSVIDPVTGKPMKDVTAKELKETLTGTTSTLNLLIKLHEKVMNMDRMRAMEQATISTLREIGGEEIVTRFVKMMETNLENL